MKNKTTAIILAILAAGGGYWLWNAYKQGNWPFKKKPDPEPTPLPPAPGPLQPIAPPAPAPGPARETISDAKARELQALLAKRYAQANLTGYTSADVDGKPGSKTNGAIQKLRPQTFQNMGPVSAANLDQYIAIFTKDVTDFVAAADAAKTKSTSKAANARQTKEILRLVKAGTHFAELMADVRSGEMLWDPVNTTYRATGVVETFRKGTRFTKSDNLGERSSDGTFIYFRSGGRGYAINPGMLIVRKA